MPSSGLVFSWTVRKGMLGMNIRTSLGHQNYRAYNVQSFDGYSHSADSALRTSDIEVGLAICDFCFNLHNVEFISKF
jgi:hypothetical protein